MISTFMDRKFILNSENEITVPVIYEAVHSHANGCKAAV